MHIDSKPSREFQKVKLDSTKEELYHDQRGSMSEMEFDPTCESQLI